MAFEKLGFSVAPNKVTENPGKHFCRFIGMRNCQNIEFIDLPDKAAHVREVQEDIKRLGGDMFTGLSFRANEPLEGYFKTCEKRLTHLEPIFIHRNYSWKTNSEDRLPGWNYLNFEKRVLPKTEFWITEFQNREVGNKVRTGVNLFREHPNTANTLVGVVFRQEGVAPLLQILGAEPNTQRVILGAHGVTLYFDGDDILPEVKEGSVQALILQADDRNEFSRVSGLEPTLRVTDADAFHIKRVPYKFDILII